MVPISLKLINKKHVYALAFCGVFFINAPLVLAQPPIVYLDDAEKITAIKAHPTSTQQQNIELLAKQADKMLTKNFGSVMDKKFTTPSGNQHNYMSMARYYWPDPSKPDGKPYIRKDGQKNPDNDKVSDDKNFDDLIDAVHDVAWAYFFTNQEKYAAKATQLIRFWFLDTATMMLPNMNNAQIRTGIDTGVSTGIIDSHNLPQILDAIGLIRSSKAWNQQDEAGIKQWFSTYLNWLLTSKNGVKEGQAKNNHGTFYDLQVVSIALFCGQNNVAEKLINTLKNRMALQIESDGKQPLELDRTASLGYSTFNLQAWSRLATVAEKAGANLWHYQSPNGGSISKAIDFLVPFVLDGKPWPYQQINPYKTQDFYQLLLLAAEKLPNASYQKMAEKIRDTNKEILIKILYE